VDNRSAISAWERRAFGDGHDRVREVAQRGLLRRNSASRRYCPRSSRYTLCGPPRYSYARAWRTTSAIAAGSYPALSEDCECTATFSDTHWYTMYKATLPDHRKLPKQALYPDTSGLARTYSSKLVAGAGQSSESARMDLLQPHCNRAGTGWYAADKADARQR
jgi:hypothetical protein